MAESESASLMPFFFFFCFTFCSSLSICCGSMVNEKLRNTLGLLASIASCRNHHTTHVLTRALWRYGMSFLRAYVTHLEANILTFVYESLNFAV
jgi:hypothetical protein